MANCSITSGIGITCADLKKPGGVAKRVWLGNITDLRDPFPITSSSYITTIEMNTYVSLYKFESAKFAHEASWTQQIGDGGSVSYQHQVILRLFNNDPTDDLALENLSVADVFAIVQTNANEFLIYGGENGMSAGDGTQGGTGRNTGDATVSVVTLQGPGQYLPKRLLIGSSVANTLAQLNAMSA